MSSAKDEKGSSLDQIRIDMRTEQTLQNLLHAYYASKNPPFPLSHIERRNSEGNGMYGPSDADFATDKRPQNGVINAQPALMVPSWVRSAHHRIAFQSNGRNFAEAGTV